MLDCTERLIKTHNAITVAREQPNLQSLSDATHHVAKVIEIGQQNGLMAILGKCYAAELQAALRTDTKIKEA